MKKYIKETEKYLLDDILCVKELIEFLKKYPKNMKILTTWESTLNILKKENIYESFTGTLYLDADYNFYKKEFAKNSKENE